jgi:restriction system protein
MARKKQSPAEDLMDLVAMLPWWAGVWLALISYLVLHRFAVTPNPVAVQPGQMGDFVGRTLVATFALFGQYLLPFLCLLGAVASFIRRRKREALVDGVGKSDSAGSLNRMSWREFEMLVGEAFRLQGYKVSERGGGGADGGVDLVLRKGTETHLVQCKQWKAYKVDVKVVRELYGVMAAEGATGGFVMTSGTFTADAQAFARGLNIELVNGPKLFALIQQAKASRSTSTPSSIATPSPVSAPVSPECPHCGSSMVLRTAKKGVNAGSQFWGCSQYPACRGTR